MNKKYELLKRILCLGTEIPCKFLNDRSQIMDSHRYEYLVKTEEDIERSEKWPLTVQPLHVN